VSAKRLRYTVTRLCLDTGSIALLKYLEPYLPSEGGLVGLTDTGRELHLEVRQKRMYGFEDYFAQAKMNVNDTLILTPLEARRLQIEVLTKAKLASSSAPAAATQPLTERVIEDESSHVRVVRKQPAAVSPYPKGILYPSNDKTEARADHSEAGQGAAPHASSITSPSITPPNITVQISSPLTAGIPATGFQEDIRSAATPAPREISTPLDRARHTFTQIGYDVQPLESGLLLEFAGRSTGRIALAFEGVGDSSAVFKAARVKNAKYLAIVAPRERLGMIEPSGAFGQIAKVELEAIESLQTLHQHFHLTPLELEGYWNAGGLSQETLESIQHGVNERLETRGEFSFVLLGLQHFDAPCVVTPEDIVAKLPGSGIGVATTMQVLETLCKPPFMLMSSLGMGEYNLKAPLERGLEDLISYVSSLKMRLRSTSSAVKADMTLTKKR
jgi:hypothetical protein